MYKTLPLILIVIALLVGCEKKPKDRATSEKGGKAMEFISESQIDKTQKALIDKYGEENKERIEKGVQQAAALWKEEDGGAEAFNKFCLENFIADQETLDKTFKRLSTNYEVILGHNNKIKLDLLRPLHLSNFEKTPIDQKFGAWSPSAHLQNDFYKNKIAFIILLNFPHYTLETKNKIGDQWSRKQWAYARMGDLYNSRVPAEIKQRVSEKLTGADTYISEYNIYVGNLVDKEGNTYFPEDLKLITHWGLRDELKSRYADENGLPNQKMIYEVMKRIIRQEIPKCLIDNDKYQWNPYTNKVYENGEEAKCKPEPNTRYKVLSDNFEALNAMDSYSPNYPTYINRKFDEEFEIPMEQTEQLFTELVSSEAVAKAAKLIEKRLGRKLQPFDIWYDGFKSRSAISEEKLDKIVKEKYPTKEAFKKDLPNLLQKLGFDKYRAKYIASKISVDPSRGAGHAWGAQMKSADAHLRTRVGDDGMNYKGYNIAIHEFGHTVEQTISLQDVDYYMLHGIPNTAFTEAWAFIFQKRDLQLLGIDSENPDKKYLDILDNFWSTYEIMGVSLVDINVWKWLYDNPDATPEELKAQTITIAKDIWNKYYAPVFGMKDEPILAVYSHMIDNPLYLSAYPLGKLIQFQIENYMEGKSIGDEMTRICKLGSITPNQWMKEAVGNEISVKPLIEAASEAASKLK